MGINLEKLVDSHSASYSDLVEFVTESGKSIWKGTMENAIDLSENFNLHKFIEPTGFNKAKMAIVVSPLYEETKEEKQPKQSKYDLSDKNKVLNAIKYFNYVKDDEEGYAHAIIDGMHQCGVGVENIPSDNRLLKYVDSCTADLSEDGHLSGIMSPEDIAKKHNVSIEDIDKQIEMGIKVEHEHTSDDEEAKRIALDHLYELPDYYDRLEKMEEEGEKELKEDLDYEELGYALYEALLDDSDEPLLEDLNHAEKRRWRIIKNTMKFVDKESVRQAFPQLEGKPDKIVVRQLKYMLEQLPEEKKRALIQNHQAKELEAKALGVGKGHHIAGNIVAGAGGGTTGVAGVLGTAAATDLAVSSIVTSSTAGATSAVEALAGAVAGSIVGVVVGGIIAVGGLALTALAVGATIGIAKGVSNANMKKAQRRHATMMNQEGIIKELKKYGTVKEDGKEKISQSSMRLALAEGADSALVKQSQMANGWSMSKQGRYDPEMLTAKGLGAIKSTLGQTIIACIPIIGLPAAIAASIRQNNNLERINSEQYKELREFVGNDEKCKSILKKIKFELMETHPNNNKLKAYRKEFFEALSEAKEKYKGTLSEGMIPGEHKCPNCGATLDAWDGTFCDKACRDAYYGTEKKTEEPNKEESKESDKKPTNEELLMEKPLLTDDGKTEVKRYNGESYKTMKEVNDDRAKQLWTREFDTETGKQIGHGAFAPSGKYADRNDDNPSLVFKAESPISGRMLKKKVDNK